eukprot:14713562-Alexandrium_andersonii.AAC.1
MAARLQVELSELSRELLTLPSYIPAPYRFARTPAWAPQSQRASANLYGTRMAHARVAAHAYLRALRYARNMHSGALSAALPPRGVGCDSGH